MQNKKSFEIILHVGRVASLQSWEAKKSCHGQTLINERSISDYPSENHASFLGDVGLLLSTYNTFHHTDSFHHF